MALRAARMEHQGPVGLYRAVCDQPYVLGEQIRITGNGIAHEGCLGSEREEPAPEIGRRPDEAVREWRAAAS